MKRVRCIIVDDEPLAQEVIERYVSSIRELELVRVCSNALEAFEVLHNEQIDLMMLDISMPVISGLDFLRSLRKAPAVIITTAHPDFALQGYELDVIDYLVKPVSLERFMKAVNKAIELIHARNPATALSENKLPKADYMFVKSDQKLVKISFQEIEYIEGMKDYVKIFTREKMIVTLHTMKFFEANLPSSFIRIHKSYIANLDAIKSISGNEIEIRQTRIPIGSSYKEQVMKIVSGSN
jgi:DNA-binding LytR/AlgR family response regulator